MGDAASRKRDVRLPLQIIMQEIENRDASSQSRRRRVQHRLLRVEQSGSSLRLLSLKVLLPIQIPREQGFVRRVLR